MHGFIYALAVVAALGAAITALPPIWRFTKAAARVPIVLEQIVHEFSPNGGGSMRDAINRIEHRVDEHDRKLADLAELKVVLLQPGQPTLDGMTEEKR